jgi:hypothetical protein
MSKGVMAQIIQREVADMLKELRAQHAELLARLDKLESKIKKT